MDGDWGGLEVGGRWVEIRRGQHADHGAETVHET